MADVKISQLTAAVQVQDTDVLPMTSGSSTVKVSAQQLKNYAIDGLDASDSAVAGSYVTAVSESNGVVTVTREAADSAPTENSNKMVKSGGVYTALSGKQNTLTFDNSPTSGSNNPVKSGGVYTALTGKQDTLTFDNAPTQNSDNPVKSGGVYSALQNAGYTIKDETTTFTKRGNLKFVDFAVIDDATENATVICLVDATINISTEISALFGATVIVKKDNEQIDTLTLSNAGEASYEAFKKGTYEFSSTVNGLTYTQEIEIEASGTYNISFFDIVYGVEWDGSASSAWTRTDEAADFTDPSPYYNGMTGTPSSPFDNIMPWSGIEIVDDAEAGKLVKIPKFYYKWTRNGSAMKLQISDIEFDGSHISPAHADKGDGTGERDYAYVGRYHCSSTNYKSVSGVTPKSNQERSEFRRNIHYLGNKVWQWDFAMWWTINMLYLVEFADWNSQAKIGGGCSQTSSTSSSVYNMGSTDSMPYHTGTTSSSIGATVYGANQYRYIENLWGNAYTFIDGIYFNGGNVYVIKNPENFSDTTNGTLVGTRPTANGVVTEWTAPAATGFEYALYPAAVTTDNNSETYDCDLSSYGNAVLFSGGNSAQNQNNGAFYLNGSYGPYSANATIGSRLMKLP